MSGDIRNTQTDRERQRIGVGVRKILITRLIYKKRDITTDKENKGEREAQRETEKEGGKARE